MDKVWIPPIGRMIYKDGKGYWGTQRPGFLKPVGRKAGRKAFKKFLADWEAKKSANHCLVKVRFKDGWTAWLV